MKKALRKKKVIMKNSINVCIYVFNNIKALLLSKAILYRVLKLNKKS